METKVKKYDLVVKVGEYNGKGKYKNVGVMLEGERGPYILLDRTFNPAGVPSDRESIVVSMFEPKGKADGAHNNLDDDRIPF